jgi:SAM-dependent methyltransferase
MPAATIRKFIYKWAWDTRCRNVDVARVLRPLVKSETSILDVGCGEYGLSGFVPTRNIVGVDIIPADATVNTSKFVFASIVSLPFEGRSFSVAASVDVLEHLPKSLRADAVRQLVKAADKTILIAFPCGILAREIDEGFNKKLVASDQPIPEWLAEHLANKYPEPQLVLSEVEDEAERLGRRVRTSIYYSENLAVAKFLRDLAVRSKYLYLLGNVAAGFLLPVLPCASKENAYRTIVLAEFEDE